MWCIDRNAFGFTCWHHALLMYLDTASSEEECASYGSFSEPYPLVVWAARCPVGRHSVAGIGPPRLGQRTARATTFWALRHRLVRNDRRASGTRCPATEQLPMVWNIKLLCGLHRGHARPRRHRAKPPLQRRPSAGRIPRPGLRVRALYHAHRTRALRSWVYALRRSLLAWKDDTTLVCGVDHPVSTGSLAVRRLWWNSVGSSLVSGRLCSLANKGRSGSTNWLSSPHRTLKALSSLYSPDCREDYSSRQSKGPEGIESAERLTVLTLFAKARSFYGRVGK
jgi:hypothetical protein